MALGNPQYGSHARLNNKQISWLSRIPLSFWIGVGSAVVITKEFKSFFLDQVIATFLPLVGKTPMDTLNNILLVFGVVSCLVYFFFAVKQTGPIGWTARISLLLGRLQFLLGNWLQIISTRV